MRRRNLVRNRGGLASSTSRSLLMIVLVYYLALQIDHCSAFGVLDRLITHWAPKSDVNQTNSYTLIKDVANQNPIVFIPGDGGSQLQAKLNKSERVHYVCDLVSDWYDIWLNIHLLVYPAFDCLCDNMKLYYNATTRTTYNSPGVQIRPTNFGSLDSVDYLDIVRVPGTAYFDNIIATLEKQNGYVRNVDMVGAAFDFRKAPNELAEFFDDLKSLIEEHYVRNNYRPVTLICHSMGCLNSLYLLNKQTENWKEIYVKRLISLAAPWSGSFKAISAMLYGDNLGIPLLNKNKLQALQSTFPSLMYLFPKLPAFNRSRVLIATPTKNYTLENLDDLFVEAKLPDQREMWHDTREIANNLRAPNVELWCLYGSGVDTPSQVIYTDSFDKYKYLEVQGDGDGTVNVESLRACEDFASQQQKPVYTRMFEKLDHISILRGSEAATFISEHIMVEDLMVDI